VDSEDISIFLKCGLSDASSISVSALAVSSDVGIKFEEICYPPLVYSARDEDSNAVSVPVGASNSFAIDSTNGQIIVQNAVLDYESIRLYSVRITVTDDAEDILSDSAIVTIHVDDQNEAPKVVKDVSCSANYHNCFKIKENSEIEVK
jgi:hypothetical protein